jgi:hypothetical protein
VQHRGVLIAWIITIGAFLAGILGGIVELAILPHFAAMALAIMTVKRTERTGELRRVLLYRASLVLLLLATSTCLVAAGSTVFIPQHIPGTHVAGFITLATTNLVVAVLAWRALVNPAPRRAALVGLAAVFVETFAMLTDIIIDVGSNGVSGDALSRGKLVPVALFAAFAATWTGALVCMAALGTFDRSGMVVVPEARVVDDA